MNIGAYYVEIVKKNINLAADPHILDYYHKFQVEMGGPRVGLFQLMNNICGL